MPTWHDLIVDCYMGCRCLCSEISVLQSGCYCQAVTFRLLLSGCPATLLLSGCTGCMGYHCLHCLHSFLACSSRWMKQLSPGVFAAFCRPFSTAPACCHIGMQTQLLLLSLLQLWLLLLPVSQVWIPAVHAMLGFESTIHVACRTTSVTGMDPCCARYAGF